MSATPEQIPAAPHGRTSGPEPPVLKLTGYALEKELDINLIAQTLGDRRRYRWEEPLILSLVELAPGTSSSLAAVPHVYLYHFGGLVFVNAGADTILFFFDHLKRSVPALGELRGVKRLRYREEYALELAEQKAPSTTTDCALIPADSAASLPVYTSITAFVLAQSVALERIEGALDVVFDEVEPLITELSRDRLAIPPKTLARLNASILNFKYKSLSYLMVLDKPDATWDDEGADRLYTALVKQFEVTSRYSSIRHKSETLLGITEVFTGQTHARRSARLEWIIIILIAAEFLFAIMRHGS